MNWIKKIVLILLAVNMLSCVKNVDFNQVDDIEFTPTYVLALLNIQVPKTNLITKIVQDKSFQISNEVNLPIYKLKGKLSKMILDFKIENAPKNDLLITLNFTDKNNSNVYEIVKQNVKYQEKDSVVSFQKEIIASEKFLKTERVQLVIKVKPTTRAIDTSNMNKLFKFKSAAKFFLKVK